MTCPLCGDELQVLPDGWGTLIGICANVTCSYVGRTVAEHRIPGTQQESGDVSCDEEL